MLEELREIVCEANLELLNNNLVKATSGNVSGRDKETGFIVIKPSGIDFKKLKPEMLVVVNIKGEIIEGSLRPSVDTKSHLYVYEKKQEIGGIVHTHSPFATSFALLGENIPICLTSLAMEFGDKIPVSDFVEIGSEEIGKEIVKKIGECPAILMRNHGVFTIGINVREALKAAIMIEEAAEIVHLAMLRGSVNELPKNIISKAFEFYHSKYGQV